jgi:hypothetical protein
VFVLLITCLQYVVVTVSKEHVIYLFFFFRSRSYPVPHRGERVKQRTVHVRNWKQNYSNEKYHIWFIFVICCIYTDILYSMWLLDVLVYCNCALTAVSFCLFFATFRRHNFAPFSCTDDILCYIVTNTCALTSFNFRPQPQS